VSSNNFAVLRIALRQNPLDEVVAVLVAGDINQRNARSVNSAFADTIEIATQKITTSNLQEFLNYLGGILIRTVLSSEANDMIDGTAAVGRGTMLADVLNAPVTKLTVSDDVNVGKYLLYTESLLSVSMDFQVLRELSLLTNLVFFEAVLKDVLDD
jgi:hypothetical protein